MLQDCDHDVKNAIQRVIDDGLPNSELYLKIHHCQSDVSLYSIF